MSYKHILVAVDLSDDSERLLKKADALASALDAQLSLVHIDVNYAELYTGLIDINLVESRNRVIEEAQQKLNQLASDAQSPVTHTLVSSGDLAEEITESIQNMGIDLVVVGHHQDFWSSLLSSTKQLLNKTPVDLLMVPIRD
ncbi:MULTISPECIES: universal stress protein [unclassified Salinivibrio]|uniref:universal stress protein n=1 Tax=unclassified Salinivibrio TaxID=2636825 RepID=UPI00061453F2|nr:MULTISPECIES: universal stress protein [unclassified Salinivibrio]KKA44850.1 universal stress global response regulator UspA [Salinivibrio sp. KP-1]MPS33580.1 universal stress global response regulator UspA [Salinivibrio sp. VYel7]MPX92030.1 universal stress global response regulator UspA [Salinivibrio sp. VYel1]MPX94963.1 universal stress global response regulator UspA [Salinivibrio sp. VYel9]MPX96648.1 universal stress global response regulator UspA [Salinivibrio sp. VYel6]